MTTIFAANLTSTISSDKINFLKYYFNDGLINRIHKSPNEAHKLKRVTSRLMLVQIFLELSIGLDKLKNIYYNSHGKLMLDNLDLNISLSYSGNKVVCLVSDDKIGLDMEDITSPPKQYCINLLEKLTNANINTEMDFYYLWTQIESIVKIYDDKGLKDIFYGNLFTQTHYTKQLLYDQEYLISTSSINQLTYLEPIKTLLV